MNKINFKFLLIISIVFFSCSNGNKDFTIDQLITLFKSQNIEGEKGMVIFQLNGAIDGCKYKNEDGTVALEVYKFEENSQIHVSLPYKNGNFGMSINNPKSGEVNQRILDIFNSFGESIKEEDINIATEIVRKKEIAKRELQQKIDEDTNSLLVFYDESITHIKKFKKVVSFADRELGSASDYEFYRNNDWKQDVWNECVISFGIDSLKTEYLSKFGENEFNILKLKLRKHLNTRANYGMRNKIFDFQDNDVIDDFTPFISRDVSIKKLKESQKTLLAFPDLFGTNSKEEEYSALIKNGLDLINENSNSQEAKILFLKALELDDSRVEAYYGLGASNMEKHSKLALEYLEKVVEIDSSYRSTYYLIASSKFHLFDLKGAVEAMNVQISLDSTVPEYFNTRAAFYMVLNDTVSACSDFKKFYKFKKIEIPENIKKLCSEL